MLHGDTRVSHKGLDTYGSRSLAVGGIALYNACQKVIEKAKPVAAHMLECDPNDLEFTDGVFQVRGTPGASRTMADCALAVFAAHDLPDGIEPTLDADAVYDPDNFSFPHGTHLCAVDVDTETGKVTIRKYVAVDDIGNVINPMIVEGQVHGGIAQGIAQALFEEAVYDENGTLITGSFVDYTIPSAADLINFTTDRTVSPAPGPSARHEGRRRGRHDRVHARRGQRGRRRAASARRQRHRHAVYAGAGLAGGEPPSRFRRGHRREHGRPRPGPAWRCRMIPAVFDYVKASSVDDALRRSPPAARTRRSSPAVRA